MSTETELRAALDRHLDTMPGRPVVDWDNVGLDQKPETYLSQVLHPAEDITVGIEVGGSDILAGIYQININAPKGGGKKPYLDELERIKAWFVRSSSLVEGGTRVVLHKIWAGAAMTDKTHYRVPVSIRYRAP
jgi:hypothetical protein